MQSTASRVYLIFLQLTAGAREFIELMIFKIRIIVSHLPYLNSDLPNVCVYFQD